MMTEPEARQTRDLWYTLAQRHMRIAEKLHQENDHDVAIFHAYHAYECMLCAFIASERWEVPPNGKITFRGDERRGWWKGPLAMPVDNGEHEARAKFAEELLKSDKSYYQLYLALDHKRWMRNGSLYIEDKMLPSDRLNTKDSAWCIKKVQKFMQEVWNDIQHKP